MTPDEAKAEGRFDRYFDSESFLADLRRHVDEGGRWTDCDVESCPEVACRIITNPATDEILRIVCLAHADTEE